MGYVNLRRNAVNNRTDKMVMSFTRGPHHMPIHNNMLLYIRADGDTVERSSTHNAKILDFRSTL